MTSAGEAEKTAKTGEDGKVQPHLACYLMSEEQLKAFLEKVKGDTSLQEKLKAAGDSDAVLAIAKEEGFSISADVLKKTQSELSEEELENVAGGAPCHFEYSGVLAW